MTKIKVGIISHYYNNNNYGGILQAYALCKFFQEYGVDAKQISYDISNKKFVYRSWIYKKLRKSYQAFRNCIGYVFHFSTSIKLNKRKKLLQKFRNSIPHTKIVYDLKNICKCNNFDIYITGSDQVWNPSWYDDAYLLNFVASDKVKLSYAASIGKNILTDESEDCFNAALRAYAAISVRERNAVKLLHKTVDKKVELVLDPTLLLNKSEWEDLCEGEYPKQKYVFCYFLGNYSMQRKLAIDYANKKGYKVVSVPYLNGKYRKVDAKMQCIHIYDLSPGRFLNMIRHAECVFTDSFHATVFSHIFKRDFFVFINGSSVDNMSDRFYTLTSMFDTRDRVCDSNEKTNIQYLLNTGSVNYNKEFSRFEQIKQSSIKFLNDNIMKRVCD